MRDLYNQILLLLNEVPALKWKDLNIGQLAEEQPPVSFPCALINIDLPNCNDIDDSGKLQQVASRFQITLAIKSAGETNANAPELQRANALDYFDLVESVYKKLQSFQSQTYAPFSRRSQQTIFTRKGLTQVVLTFETSWHDYSANS